MFYNNILSAPFVFIICVMSGELPQVFNFQYLYSFNFQVCSVVHVLRWWELVRIAWCSCDRITCSCASYCKRHWLSSWIIPYSCAPVSTLLWPLQSLVGISYGCLLVCCCWLLMTLIGYSTKLNNLIGQIKNILTTLVGYFIFGDVSYSFLNVVGLFISTFARFFSVCCYITHRPHSIPSHPILFYSILSISNSIAQWQFHSIWYAYVQFVERLARNAKNTILPVSQPVSDRQK